MLEKQYPLIQQDHVKPLCARSKILHMEFMVKSDTHIPLSVRMHVLQSCDAWLFNSLALQWSHLVRPKARYSKPSAQIKHKLQYLLVSFAMKKQQGNIHLARIYKLFSCTFISYYCCNLQALPLAAPPSNQHVKLALSTIGSQVVVAINIKHGLFSSLKHRQFSSLKHGQFSSLKYSSPKLTLFNILERTH